MWGDDITDAAAEHLCQIVSRANAGIAGRASRISSERLAQRRAGAHRRPHDAVLAENVRLAVGRPVTFASIMFRWK